ARHVARTNGPVVQVRLEILLRLLRCDRLDRHLLHYGLRHSLASLSASSASSTLVTTRATPPAFPISSSRWRCNRLVKFTRSGVFTSRAKKRPSMQPKMSGVPE